MKIVLWLALACVVVMGALFAVRHLPSREDRPAPAEPVVAEAPVAPPPVAETPTVAPEVVAAPKPVEVDPQIADDAAAVGMTTREPEGEAATPPQ